MGAWLGIVPNRLPGGAYLKSLPAAGRAPAR
jgi:hypothetical protein